MKALLASGLLTLFSVVSSQSIERSHCIIYQGYVRGDVELWKKGMAESQKAYNREPSSSTLYAMTESRYGFIGYLLDTGNKALIKVHVDTLEQEIEKLEDFADYKAETEAFRVALLGFRMGLNPAMAVILGPRALKQLEKAMADGVYSPYVWVEKANSEAHMPAFAGGSKIKAAESYREALRLFELNKEALNCNWRYLNTFVLLGKTLEQNGDYNGAREAYGNALVTEPAFKWVRDELLPAVEKRLKQTETTD